MEQNQQANQMDVKKPKQRYKKVLIWIVVILAIIIIGFTSLIVTGKAGTVIYFVVGLFKTPAIRLTSFGFNADYSGQATQLALEKSTCVYLQGASTSEITDITFKVDYGSIEVGGQKVADVSNGITAAYASVLPDDCSFYLIFGLDPHPWEKSFAEPFKYIAPKAIPSGNKDTITVQITNKQGIILKESLTVNLVTAGETK